jgi:hypothetical protein
MYAGTTFRRGSGRIVGVHQKIDRAARRHLNKYIPKSVDFPGTKDILHFEGTNGPDAIKHMKPSQDEPWYFIDPANPDDHELITIIHNHTVNLAEALKANNSVRAAFEAAWLAHAITDGLTPAHHYPLNDKIEELWGRPRLERTSTRDKAIIHGVNRKDTLLKNWEYWGAGGVFTAHIIFEMGVASVISTDKYKTGGPTENDIARLSKDGFEVLFMESLHKIHDMKMYDEFGKNGWTRRLATKTKKVLVPEIIKVVALAWYQAIIMATEPS